MDQTIYILRHGQTAWNAKDKERHQTHSNGRENFLTEKGLRQVDEAAKSLRDAELNYAFHSPLLRASQTLRRILKDRIPIPTYEVPALTEMSMAFLDGMNQAEWEKEFPQTIPLYAARKNDKFGCKLPEGIDYSGCFERAKQIARDNNEPGKVIPAWENYEDVVKRTKGFIDELTLFGDSSILISGHQGLNRALLGNLLVGSAHLGSIESIVDLETPNAAVFRVERSSDGVKLCHNLGKGWIPGFITKKNE